MALDELVGVGESVDLGGVIQIITVRTLVVTLPESRTRLIRERVVVPHGNFNHAGGQHLAGGRTDLLFECLHDLFQLAIVDYVRVETNQKRRVCGANVDEAVETSLFEGVCDAVRDEI